jgi:hypothetical protein
VLYRVETVFNTNDGNTNTYIDIPVEGFFFGKKEELDALLEQHGEFTRKMTARSWKKYEGEKNPINVEIVCLRGQEITKHNELMKKIQGLMSLILEKEESLGVDPAYNISSRSYTPKTYKD